MDCQPKNCCRNTRRGNKDQSIIVLAPLVSLLGPGKPRTFFLRSLRKITLPWRTLAIGNKEAKPLTAGKPMRTPPPPTLWRPLFDPSIACNLHNINSLHFYPIDESVTANPRFCPFFSLKWPRFSQKRPHFRPKNNRSGAFLTLSL